MRVTMLSLAADERRTLEIGKTYNIPDKEAVGLLEGKFAKQAAASAKVTKIPAKPDPEEDEFLDDEDEDQDEE